jgi:hypothetical protein
MSMSSDLTSRSRPSAQGIQSRPIRPARGPSSRDTHERKRSRLSTDSTTPLDSVDYWIDFDKDDSLASVPEGFETPRQAMEGKGKGPMTSG